MSSEEKEGSVRGFWARFHQWLSNVQDSQFDRGEQELRNLMEQDEKKDIVPIPMSFLMAVVWVFILVFPLVVMVEPSAPFKINKFMIAGFYTPLVATLLMYGLNMGFLTRRYFLKKRFFCYVLGNTIALGLVLLAREIVFFLISREPGEGVGEFFTAYFFQAERNHFTVWTVLSFCIFLTIICFLCVTICVFSRQIIRSFILREKKKADMQYELDFLKRQLSPHFLFNTLNNITSLIRVDPSLAENSMVKLSKLLREMLYQSADEYIEIAEDADILKKYCELEKLRLPEDFDLAFETDFKDPHCKVEPFLTMPLLENAMKHCINPEGQSFAHFKISQDDDSLYFRSENSNFPRKQKPGASGLGLATFKKRLELLYANRYSYTTKIERNAYISELRVRLK